MEKTGGTKLDNLEDFIEDISERKNLSKEELNYSLGIAKKLMEKRTKIVNVGERDYNVTKTALGPIKKDDHNNFYQINFEIDDIWEKYMVLTKSELDPENHYLPAYDNKKDLYLRIDSGCEPGQTFQDQMCDCFDQLHMAIDGLINSEQGLIIHIPKQDGRGRGTDFHLATLYLQEELNVNTVESFSLLGEDSSEESLDVRTYEGAIATMKYLGIDNNFNIKFGTNNKKKIDPLEKEGYNIIRSPTEIEPTKYTKQHLQAKKEHLGHFLENENYR
ncbi:MAG: hypothetical protein ACQEP1_06090 [Nanobdellota archaeon]